MLASLLHLAALSSPWAHFAHNVENAGLSLALILWSLELDSSSSLAKS